MYASKSLREASRGLKHAQCCKNTHAYCLICICHQWTYNFGQERSRERAHRRMHGESSGLISIQCADGTQNPTEPTFETGFKARLDDHSTGPCQLTVLPAQQRNALPQHVPTSGASLSQLTPAAVQTASKHSQALCKPNGCAGQCCKRLV